MQGPHCFTEITSCPTAALVPWLPDPVAKSLINRVSGIQCYISSPP